MAEAVDHHRAGRLQQAAAAYVAVLQADPKNADALHLLGLVMYRLGHPAEALDLMDRALKIDKRLAPAHSNRALVLRHLGRLDEAADSLKRALRLRPELSEAWLELARVEHARGRHEASVDAARKARAARPGDRAAAEVLGAALLSAGRLPDAVRLCAELVLEHPGEIGPAVALADAVAACDEVPDGLDDALLAALATPGVDHQRLDRAVRAALDPLRRDPAALKRAPLLVPWLSRVVVRHPAWERALGRLRAHLLETREPLEAIVAVGVHGWRCEHVWSSSSAEARALRELDRAEPLGAALAAMYGPLDPRWLADGWEEGPLAPLVRASLADPATERALAETTEELTPDHHTSGAVRAMYEAHPYPRLVSVQLRERASLSDVLASVLPGVDGLPQGPVRVLVAGAGTGQHPLTSAATWDCEVLAVDLSRASLARGLRVAGELGLPNVRFVRGDLLELGRLDETFDVVESVGVLHHLDDPLAGWRVLVDRVAPGGVMRIGLYAERGRSDVVAARRLIAARGFPTTDQGIRAARQALLELPDDHPAHPVVWSPDFTSVTGCRDLVFHVREHRYTLPRLQRELDALDLELLGFQHANPAVPALYRERWPDDRRQVDLERWEQLEAEHPRIFSGMYVFWTRPRRRR